MLPATAIEPMHQKYMLKKACRERFGKNLIRRYLQARQFASSATCYTEIGIQEAVTPDQGKKTATLNTVLGQVIVTLTHPYKSCQI